VLLELTGPASHTNYGQCQRAPNARGARPNVGFATNRNAGVVMRTLLAFEGATSWAKMPRFEALSQQD